MNLVKNSLYFFTQRTANPMLVPCAEVEAEAKHICKSEAAGEDEEYPLLLQIYPQLVTVLYPPSLSVAE